MWWRARFGPQGSPFGLMNLALKVCATRKAVNACEGLIEDEYESGGPTA